jgi:hypothetical protein
MSRWEPHIDLMRLLESLGNEIAAATEQEVRAACVGGGWSVGGSVKEVRELIGAVNGDQGEPEAGLLPADVMRLHEHYHKQH